MTLGNVKVLQTALGIKADSVFGPKTEEAVKAFQTSKFSIKN